MLAFSQSSGWQRHNIFGSSVLSSHIFVGIFKRHSPTSLPQLRLHKSPADLHKALLATGPAAWEFTQIQLLGNHWFWLLLPPPQSAPLYIRQPDVLKVHHSPLHSEKSMSTPLCFPRRRRPRKCQVLYWWEIRSDCHWAGRTWVVGSAGATELENGPNNMLQSKESSLASTLQECILLALQHFLWDLGESLKYIWVWNASSVKEK